MFFDSTSHISFELCVKNFALNLPNIWNESSADELSPFIRKPTDSNDERSAIVIGRGPSIKQHNHLELLSESKFDGTIICTDFALADALNAGITPEKFPEYYVASIDPHEKIHKAYDQSIIEQYGPKIKGIFSTAINPLTVKTAREKGISPFWLHPLIDYNEGPKSFNQIAALMTRAKNHTNGLPAIQTGGNVGTSCWFIAWQILKISKIVLIGINHGWTEDDAFEKIVTHGGTHKQLDLDQNSSLFEAMYPKIYNPDFDCYCIQDPVYQCYSNALIEFIKRTPSWVTTINATEGGSIFGEKILCTKFSDFLKQFKQ